jgi:hypothetical protein
VICDGGGEVVGDLNRVEGNDERDVVRDTYIYIHEDRTEIQVIITCDSVLPCTSAPPIFSSSSPTLIFFDWAAGPSWLRPLTCGIQSPIHVLGDAHEFWC